MITTKPIINRPSHFISTSTYPSYRLKRDRQWSDAMLQSQNAILRDTLKVDLALESHTLKKKSSSTYPDDGGEYLEVTKVESSVCQQGN